MRQRFWAVLGLVVGSAVAAHALSVTEIPDPRRTGGWSLDWTGQIPGESLRQVDEIAGRVKEATGGEIVVAVVRSTEGAPPRRFATDLFNHWHIGDVVKNNGVLIFAALEDRKLEIVLGDGLAPAVYKPVSASILEEEILPRLRQGDPGGALLQGARAVAERVYGIDGGEPQAEQPAAVPPAAAPAPPFGSDLVPLPEASAQAPAVSVPPPPPSLLGQLLVGVLVIGFGVLAFVGIASWRRQLRRCSQCGTETVLLDEAEDDAHLTPAEQAEERVGSVDYRVRACPACGSVRKVGRGRFFSSYSHCPTCKAKTVSGISTVLRHATYDYGGVVRVDERCEHCGHADSYERSTPPETRPEEADSRTSAAGTAGALWAASGSSGSSSSISSSSSFSSSSSSSSDSSSGDGGGSSSGEGGASGSW